MLQDKLKTYEMDFGQYQGNSYTYYIGADTIRLYIKNFRTGKWENRRDIINLMPFGIDIIQATINLLNLNADFIKGLKIREAGINSNVIIEVGELKDG